VRFLCLSRVCPGSPGVFEPFESDRFQTPFNTTRYPANFPREMEASAEATRPPLQRLPTDTAGTKPGRPREEYGCSLTILCPDVEDGGGILDELSPTDTLAMIRTKILEEFDADQLPDGVKDGSVDFFFKIGFDRCSSSQESKKRVLDIKTAVTIVAKKQKVAPPVAPPPPAVGAPDAPCPLATSRAFDTPRAADRADADECSGKRQRVDGVSPEPEPSATEMAPAAAAYEPEAEPAADSAAEEPPGDVQQPTVELPAVAGVKAAMVNAAVEVVAVAEDVVAKEAVAEETMLRTSTVCQAEEAMAVLEVEEPQAPAAPAPSPFSAAPVPSPFSVAFSAVPAPPPISAAFSVAPAPSPFSFAHTSRLFSRAITPAPAPLVTVIAKEVLLAARVKEAAAAAATKAAAEKAVVVAAEEAKRAAEQARVAEEAEAAMEAETAMRAAAAKAEEEAIRRKTAATVTLQALVQKSPLEIDLEAVDEAARAAETAGVAPEEVASARQLAAEACARRQRRDTAAAALAAVVAAPPLDMDVAAAEVAAEEAEAAGVSAAAMGSARERIDTAAQAQQLRDVAAAALTAATAVPPLELDVAAAEAAAAAAESAGVSALLVGEARQLAGVASQKQVRRDAAAAALAAVVAALPLAMELDMAKAAAAAAEAAGVPSATIECAREAIGMAALAQTERREQAAVALRRATEAAHLCSDLLLVDADLVWAAVEAAEAAGVVGTDVVNARSLASQATGKQKKRAEALKALQLATDGDYHKINVEAAAKACEAAREAYVAETDLNKAKLILECARGTQKDRDECAQALRIAVDVEPLAMDVLAAKTKAAEAANKHVPLGEVERAQELITVAELKQGAKAQAEERLAAQMALDVLDVDVPSAKAEVAEAEAANASRSLIERAKQHYRRARADQKRRDAAAAALAAVVAAPPLDMDVAAAEAAAAVAEAAGVSAAAMGSARERIDTAAQAQQLRDVAAAALTAATAVPPLELDVAAAEAAAAAAESAGVSALLVGEARQLAGVASQKQGRRDAAAAALAAVVAVLPLDIDVAAAEAAAEEAEAAGVSAAAMASARVLMKDAEERQHLRTRAEEALAIALDKPLLEVDQEEVNSAIIVATGAGVDKARLADAGRRLSEIAKAQVEATTDALAGVSNCRPASKRPRAEELSDDSDDDSLPSGSQNVPPPTPPVPEHDLSSAGRALTAPEQYINECRGLLGSLRSMILDEPLLGTEQRRGAWVSRAEMIMDKGFKNTVIGVLGGTGVGKSSLLNALLDEASVLPTSGSQGCTAAPIELRFNSALQQTTEGLSGLHVYTARVEFISQDDWDKELPRLVADICSNEDSFHGKPRSDEGKEAWQKLEHVYGSGLLHQFELKTPMADVLQALSADRVLRTILAPTKGEHCSVKEWGKGVPNDAAEAASLVSGRLDRAQLARKREWASEFRQSLEPFVYRDAGSGGPGGRQKWPLVKRVVLQGPWPALRSGACFVDLPGVHDSNIARAKVAANYLPRCTSIWIVAPISRAVDNKQAKDLLGEQFKRQLLMDGQYGAVSFICTQTDDCSPSEIVRDHADLAAQVPMRLETMQAKLKESERARAEIEELDSAEAARKETLGALQLAKEEAQARLKVAKKLHKKALGAWEAKVAAGGAPVTAQLIVEPGGTVRLATGTDAALAKAEALHLQHARDEASDACEVEAKQHQAWVLWKSKQMMHWRRQQSAVLADLKPLCALVRNEFARSRIQEDFRAGLEELTHVDEEEREEGTSSSSAPLPKPLPDDHKIDVHCVSANDYLKLMGIKQTSDGEAATFKEVADTNIPALRVAIERTCRGQRELDVRSIVRETSDLIDEVQLALGTAGEPMTSDHRGDCDEVLSQALERLRSVWATHCGTLDDGMKREVNTCLEPKFKRGAESGKQQALSIVQSWGSGLKRTNGGAGGGALEWGTYAATAKRDGVYKSASAGEIDWNQDLADPIQKALMVGWEATMNTKTNELLHTCCVAVKHEAATANDTIKMELACLGIPQDALARMWLAAGRAIETTITDDMRAVAEHATQRQREISRTLQPQIRQKMLPGYAAACAVSKGAGRFPRMKSAVNSHAETALDGIFTETTGGMLLQIADLIDVLRGQVAALCDKVAGILRRIYSAYWEREEGAATISADVRAARDLAALTTAPMRTKLDEAMARAGIRIE